VMATWFAARGHPVDELDLTSLLLAGAGIR
jgi:hypothetical protein